MINEFQRIVPFLIQKNLSYRAIFGKDLFSIKNASSEEITSVENSIHFKFPDYYKVFQMKFNPTGLQIMFVEILGLEELINTFNETYMVDELVELGYMPIFIDNSGDLYCIKSKDESQDLFSVSHDSYLQINLHGKVNDYLKILIDTKLKLN